MKDVVLVVFGAVGIDRGFFLFFCFLGGAGIDRGNVNGGIS